ncbi:hypothetical protein ACIPUB_06550 [Paeniglutamicibacter sp. ORCA_105]|uniref:hypothetical protein n=1 Tax=Paeniglutamicibacter sp. ORCA_105 TaxID=3377336 RepID=UPI003893D15E
MSLKRTKDEVVSGTADELLWWIEQREGKLQGAGSETMGVNPFMLPVVAALHGLDTQDELATLLMAAHLMQGHSTGFGKLLDEKLLPKVFGTTKLDKKFRKNTPPYSHSAFNEIDHLVTRPNGIELLSLKASPWTINLSTATELNKSFKGIRDSYITPYPGIYIGIAMGVTYGAPEALTDKYQILRGLRPDQRSKHMVDDLTQHVSVYAGREFWAWLNFGEMSTQDWVMEGILKATKSIDGPAVRKTHLINLAKQYSNLPAISSSGGAFNWESILERING